MLSLYIITSKTCGVCEIVLKYLEKIKTNDINIINIDMGLQDNVNALAKTIDTKNMRYITVPVMYLKTKNKFIRLKVEPFYIEGKKYFNL